MKSISTLTISLLCATALSKSVFGFCGFYVAKADTTLFNKASQVVIARNGKKTVITMTNDFKGDPKEFAIVIPVPSLIEKGQIHIGDKKIIEHLDAYSSPRLVEYFDSNPCAPMRAEDALRKPSSKSEEKASYNNSLGVAIEAKYTVGEYDVVILSAKDSRGLEVWLRNNGYRIPDGASEILGSYIKQKMRFFVAKVNLNEQSKLGFRYLRPIQVAYESPKFMLPIRLGTLNADGPQELFIYFLSRNGRVETTNYRTVKLPTGMNLPLFIKNEFGEFYRAMFNEQVKKENMRAVFLEYAWDMNWCDPCAADPLSSDELRSLGVFWIENNNAQYRNSTVPTDVFITRLHVNYNKYHFPEDLIFQETGDRTHFQGRYVLQNPWTGSDSCEASKYYEKKLHERQENEARTLANLTGWNISNINKKIDYVKRTENGEKPWWKTIWTD
jgi:hypothetical protein